jgi:tRNA G18 (ribose-2'-O)-methylase SpoU
MVYTQKVKLDRMVSNAPHQNVVLKCSPLPENVINKDSKQVFENGVYVYTDKITDPQNFGAIIRSSLFFGVKHIFSSKKNHCPLNATVSKASTGAVELMPISLIENSENFMVNWKAQGGFILSTEVTDLNRRVYPVQELQKLKAEDKLEKMLIVLGSEGFGVSDHLRKHSDYNIIIERKG